MNASIYLNEWDAYPAQWLRNLYSDAVVDETSITCLNTESVDHDLSQYRQVHFFAGIGGWPEALDLAGWPEAVPIWTGSCPCQPFSSAGDQRGFDDERDLWPHMFRQIERFRPGFVVGEQVANGSLPLQWLDRVFSDLESAGYTCWAVDLPAACVGSPIIRQRLFWGAFRGEWAVGNWQCGRAGDLSRSDCDRQRDAEGPTSEERSCSRSESAGELPLRPERPGRTVTVSGSAGSRLSGREDSGAGAGDAGADRRGSFESQRSGDARDLPRSAGGGQRRGTGAGGSDGPQAEHGGSSGSCLERSESDGRQPRRAPSDGRLAPGGCGSVRELAISDGVQLQGLTSTWEQPVLEQGSGADEPSGRPVACAEHRRCSGRNSKRSGTGATLSSGQACSGQKPFAIGHQPASFWRDFDIIRFTDGKQRRIEPGLVPLAHGLPAGNAWAVPRLGELGIDAGTAKRIVALARSCRVGTLRGFGNAIVPQVAARFLRVWMEVLGIETKNEEQ